MEKIAVSTKEAAALLSLHPRTVRRLVRANKLAAVRVGAKILVSREALERFARAMG